MGFYRARLGGVGVDFSQVNFTGELVSFDGVDVLGRSVRFNQANLSCRRLVVADARIHAESALDFSAPAVWAQHHRRPTTSWRSSCMGAEPGG